MSTPKYPVEKRGPSYSKYLSKLRRRSAWKGAVRRQKPKGFLKRKSDGQAFPVFEKKKLPAKLVPKKFRKPDKFDEFIDAEKISQDIEKIDLRIKELEAMLHHYKSVYKGKDKFEKIAKTDTDLQRAYTIRDSLVRKLKQKSTIKEKIDKAVAVMQKKPVPKRVVAAVEKALPSPELIAKRLGISTKKAKRILGLAERTVQPKYTPKMKKKLPLSKKIQRMMKGQ